MSQYARAEAAPHQPSSGASASPTTATQHSSEAQSLQPQHKRVYQACIPCRRRKVRCDLGSVDNPHEPPCVRCRRESKECYFSATRRKRKGEEEGIDDDEYIIRNGRKRVHADDTPPVVVPTRHSYSTVPLTPGGTSGRGLPLKRPKSESGDGRHGRDQSYTEMEDEPDPDTQLENLEAQSVMRQHVYGPHDALDLLYKAATDGSVSSPRFGGRLLSQGTYN